VAATTAWRIGFIAPGAFAALNQLQWTFLLGRDSLFFLMDQGSKGEGDAQA
jgi:hypothetical protein